MAELNFLKGFLYLTVGKHRNRGKATEPGQWQPRIEGWRDGGTGAGGVQAGAGGSQAASTQGFALPVCSILCMFVFAVFSDGKNIWSAFWVMCLVMALESAFI